MPVGTFSMHILVIFIGQEFWVGATGGRSVFVWYKSKTPLTYPDYMDGVGNGVGCLSFGIPTLQKYRVGPCTTKHLVICEKRFEHFYTFS